MTETMTKSQTSKGEEIKSFPLAKLQLDTRNPRFGGRAGDIKGQTAILDRIVEKFGIEDVLSSIATNGYFDAEPLVGLREKKGDEIRIVEGNRRLAACLILENDKRARNQPARVRDAQALQQKSGTPAIKYLPVKVFEEKEPSGALLSYLGVRHIVGSQAWDAYAKAAWIADVLEEQQLSLDDIVSMIGDRHRTVRRLLEGFYFVNQLIKKSRFRPEDSLRKGRGSNPEYPFSWVYTGLGYAQIREWLAMRDLSKDITSSPVAEKHIDDAADFVTFLFGNKTKNIEPSISDSRQIGDLAECVSEPKRRQLLKRERSVTEVMRLTKPAQDRVMLGLMDAEDALGGVLVTLSEGELKSRKAEELREPSKKVNSMSREVAKKISEIADAGDEVVDE